MFATRNRFARSLRKLTSMPVIASVAIVAMGGHPAHAQNTGFAGAVRRATAFTADLALRSVRPIDLEARGLTTTAFGGLTFGVSAVQVLDTSALRIRAYLLNSTDVVVRIPVPPEDSFAVIDARGRRLPTLTSPKFPRLPKGAKELTVPPLERVEVVLLFTQIPGDATEVLLRVGAAGIIRGIPLRADGNVGSSNGPGPVAPMSSPSGSPMSPTSGSPVSPTSGSPAMPSSSSAQPAAQPVTSPPASSPATSTFFGGSAGATAATSALAGDWNEPTTLAAIRLNADGTYATPAGPTGTFAAQGVWVVFTGPLAAWNSGRAVLSNGAIEFRWTDATGIERHFVFARR